MHTFFLNILIMFYKFFANFLQYFTMFYNVLQCFTIVYNVCTNVIKVSSFLPFFLPSIPKYKLLVKNTPSIDGAMEVLVQQNRLLMLMNPTHNMLPNICCLCLFLY